MTWVFALLQKRVRVILPITVVALGLLFVHMHAQAAGGLVAAYNFDEGSGTTVADASGNGNTGTTSNTAWATTGKYGKALTFNGTNSWVTVADNASLHATNGLTLEAWVDPTSNPSGIWQSVIMKQHTGDLDYALYRSNGTGKPESVIYTTAERELPGTTSMTLNTWAHLSETYDGTTMRLYVNGVQVASKAQTGNINVSNGVLRIGGNSIWNEYFKGMIDDVRIYNRALSVGEIQTDMNTPVSSTPDTTPPSVPASPNQTGSTMTSATLGWTASTDNVGVTGYDVYMNGLPVSTTVTGTNYTFTGLTCGQTYPVAVDAYDAAGNHSSQASSTISTTACDTTAPSAPTGLTQTGSTTTSASVNWTASTDNVGVTGYGLYKNGSLIGSTSATSSTFSGLACGQTYPIAVDAYDAAGNRSAQTTLSVTTADCGDTTAPSQPTGLTQTDSTATSVSVVWTASTDNVGVTGYGLYRNSTNTGSTANTSSTFSGLTCNTTYTIGIDAFDAAGNRSTTATVSATTAACPDTTAPTVSLTAPTNGDTVSGTAVALTADASDNVAVANVQFKLDGNNLGSADTTSPYATAWDSTSVANGTHTLTAVATDTANNSTTSTSVTVTVSNATGGGQVPLDTANFNHKVTVGKGFVEASARQVIRTSNDVVYVITADDTASTGGIHAWKGSPAGIPTSFTEMDTTHHPKMTDTGIGSPDTRLDRNNVVQMAYSNPANHNLYYQTFDTNTDTWSTRTTLATNAATGLNSFGQDRTGNVALLLDANDQPTVAYTTTAGSILYLPSNGSGGFAAAQTIASGLTNPIHPAMAMDNTNAIDITWVDNACVPGGGCGSTSTPSSVLKYAQRTPAGTWQTPEVVASGANAVNNNVYLDQGPAIVTNGNNVPYIEYVDSGTVSGEAGDNLKIRYRTGANTWVDDSPPAASYGSETHTPSIYSQGNDIYAVLGHDHSIHYGFLYQLGGAGNSWSPYQLLDSTQNDGSASIRWDPFRENDDRVIDTIYFNETVPQVYYMALQPRGSGSGTDTTPPTTNITSPANGATINGSSAAVNATASDNTGVTKVELYVDGVLSSTDTASPYNFTVDTTGLSDGSHSLQTKAYDAAGNTASSSLVNVTVANNTADTTAPTASITAKPTNPTSATTANFNFTGSDNVTPANLLTFQCSLDGATFSSCTSPQAYSGLATGSHTFQVQATDQAGNTSSAASYSWTIDNTAPTASITAPANNATVSGSVTVSANASDNVGVVGVQFKLDGANLGTEDTSSPYSVTWNSATASNGVHSLTAVARDASGNVTTSSTVNVTVNNTTTGQFLLGDQTLETGNDSNSGGTAEAFRTTANTTNTLNSLTVYVGSSTTATNVIVGLYTNNGSHPGTLLTSGTISNPTKNAWNTVAVPPVSVTSGTTYWIAILSPSGNGTLFFRDKAGTTTSSETSSALNLLTLPVNWTTGSTFTDGPLSAYGQN